VPGKKNKFITPGIAMVLFLALTSMFGAWLCIHYFALGFERESCERNNEKQLEHVRGITRNASEVLSLIENDLEYVASLPEIQGDDAKQAWAQLAACYKRLDGRITDIARIDAEGHVLVAYKTELLQSSTQYYPSTMEVLQTQIPALAGPFMTAQNTRAIALDVPVFRTDKVSGNEVFVGTISCLIEIDRLIKTWITPYDVHLGSFTWIVNREHKIVVHTNFDLIGKDWMEVDEASILDPNPAATDRRADKEFLKTIFSGKAGKTQMRLGSLGDEYQLIAYAPLNIAGARWVVISNTPRKAVLGPFQENLQKFWIVGGLFGGLLLVMVTFIMNSEQKKLRIERDLRRSLQQSEKKYRSLIESSNDGILLCTPDGLIRLVNRSLTEMLGYTEEELLGRNFSDYIAPSQRELLERESEKHSRNISSVYELELMTKNGEQITVIVSASPVFNNEQHVGNLSMLTDITGKKQAEQEIKRQNEELLAVYESEHRRVLRLETIYKVSDKLTGLLELDELLPVLVKLIHDTFNYYNVNLFLADKKTGELIFTAGCGGYHTPEPLGMRIKPPEGIVGSCFSRGEPILANDVLKEPSFIPLKSLPETRSEIALPLLSRDAVIGVLDVQSTSLNGFDKEDMLTLQVLAEQIGVAVENARLYDRLKRSLDEVRKSQAFFAKIVLESPLSTFITDSKGTCILINQSALSLLGNEAVYDQVVGSYNLLHDLPFAASPVVEQIRTALTGEVVQFTVDLPAPNAGLNRSRRETLTLRATIFPLTDEYGRVANIVAMFEDLTEKKQLEEALQQAQKMESIGTLAGGIAHDFNNILGGVLGYTSFLKTKMHTSDPFYRYIDIIETSARRAADLTQQLLAFARGGKYSVQMLDLNQVVKEAMQLIASTIDKKISVTLRLAPNLPGVEGDVGQIIQTIINICINARDAMISGGQLTISSSVIETQEQFLHTHPGAKASFYVLLTFTDTGIGMTEEVCQRIFEPFFTTKKDQKGTGLGLAMVYGIVKNHGGYIDVESKPGIGTTFSIYLPVSGKQAPRLVRVSSVKPKRGNETILVADDEEMMRQLIIEVLDSDGYQVIPAEDGRKALEIYSERSREIDLVILDMMMPGLSGPEAFRRLKQINPSVKVLLSSGYSQEGQAQQILKEGVLGFIQKPYAINELLNKIRFVIDRN
jgi:PAS domain S-box-containing protein